MGQKDNKNKVRLQRIEHLLLIIMKNYLKHRQNLNIN